MFKKKKEEIKEASSLEKMEGASFPTMPFQFNGTTMFCKVRCLNRMQLKAIGEFNLIDISKPTDSKEVSLDDMISTINWQEALIKETLIEPTFEEIQDEVYGKDNRISTLKEKLNVIKEKLKTLPAKERFELEKQANAIELYIGSLLPDDFMNAVTSWAIGTDRTDIKKITRDMLLECAILASNGKDNPADHLEGNFLDMHRDEINKTAWIVYNEYMKEKQIEKENSGKRVIRGGKVR